MNRRLIAIVLLVAGAGLFALGTTVEKGRHHDEPVDQSALSASHQEGGESAEQHGAETTDIHTTVRDSEEDKILGIDRESTALVTLAVLASLALAALLRWRPSRLVWAAAGLVGVASAIFDVAEIVHQVEESAAGLAGLAAVVAITHTGIAGMSAAELATSASA